MNGLVVGWTEDFEVYQGTYRYFEVLLGTSRYFVQGFGTSYIVQRIEDEWVGGLVGQRAAPCSLFIFCLLSFVGCLLHSVQCTVYRG